MEIHSNQNFEEVVIEDGTFETRDGSLGAKMKWFWLRRTSLEKALLLLVFLLLVSLIAVIAVLVINTRQTYPDSEGVMEICMDDTCVTAAGEMISNMDLLADPCEDFYQYACGNWLRNNPIPENEKGITVHHKIAADVLASCNKILNEETRINDSNDILWKMKTFFKSCLNEELIRKDGAGPLFDFLAEFGGINTEEISVADDQNATEKDMTIIFRKLYMASDAPIFVGILPTNEHIRIYNPYCYPLSRAEVENEKEFINETLSYLYPNGSPNVISHMASEFIEIHKTLVNCSSGNDVGNLTTLQTLVPKINWTSFIHSLVPESLRHYPVQLHTVEYFRILGDLLDKKSFLLIKHYMMWRVLRSLLPHTGGEIGDISRKYQVDATTSNRDRDEFCMNTSITYLEDALAGLFILKNINSEDVHSQLWLFEQIRGSFKELVELNEELDSSSKEVILQTINKIEVEVAHPKYISNHSLLNDAFRSLQIGDHYVTNLIAARGYATVYDLSGDLSAITGIIKTTSSAAFTPYTVIIPLLTLLRQSLLVPKLRSLTFSSVGVSMGHEISHSIDRKHSKEWADLREKGRAVFNDKMNCLLIALENSMDLEYGDKNLVYSKFEREFWSDVSGLQISYQAFKKAPPDNLTLPYLNITLDQIFFLNFAQTMCGHYKKDLYLSQVNLYPPPKYRVLATLRNSYSFSDAFGCPRGSKMNPSMEKCYIWHPEPN